jgi:hypothetical protein
VTPETVLPGNREVGADLRREHEHTNRSIGAVDDLVRTWVTERLSATATTEEFIALSERIAGQDLSNFFHVWLYTAGKPTTW